MLAVAADQDQDGGPREARSGQERMCAVTRQVHPTDELIRFVLGPDDRIVPDLKRRLPGRGVWISASRAVLSKAIKSGVFSKGFRKPLGEAGTLLADTERALVQSVVDALAIVGKAGQVVAGFAKVEASLRSGQVRALIHATDGAADGIRKLNGLVPRAAGDEPAGRSALQIVNALTTAELDLALNRANVVHAALLAGPAGDTFLSRAERLARFRQSGTGVTSPEISDKTRAVALRD